jgi:hypothetical protein
MGLIPLTQGKQALVDDADYDMFSQWKWCYHLGYAKRRSAGGRKGSKILFMHREINETPDGFVTDHINGDKLDNRRSNLRTATKRLNAANTGVPSNNTSGVKGVYLRSDGKKWCAVIMVEQKTIFLGSFGDINDAAMARAHAEREFRHGR